MIGSNRNKRSEFEKIALIHTDALYGGALRLTGNAGDADDLVQETLVRAYRFWNQYQPGSNCKAWLFRILKNQFINQYNKSRRNRELTERISLEASSQAGTASPLAEVATKDLGAQLTTALAELPTEFRLAVVLCDVQDMSYREIAEVMECPVGTVMSRLHRGRRLLRERLEKRSESIAATVDLTSYRHRRNHPA